MSIKRFNLPDLGEGLTEGEILQWLVEPGEQVRLNQPIVEVETAKAAVEIPSPYAGVVSEVLYEAGATVDVGAPIIAFDVGGEPDEPVAEPVADEKPERTAVLVGYGPRTAAARRRPRKTITPDEVAPPPAPDLPLLPSIPDSLSTAAKPVRHGGLEVGRATERAAAAASAPVRAKPPVRRLARDLGIDLASIRATGPNSTISRDDVQRAAHHATARPSIVDSYEPDAVSASGERRVPVKGVRKLTAEAMVASAFTAPHVTEFLTVDVTAALKAVRKLRAAPEFDGARVTPLLLFAKAVVGAAGRHPMMNSTWDEAAGEIVVKNYVNLGIAAATPRGLIVPNIKDAGALPLRKFADALTSLVSTAKAGRTAPADMSGGTLTITNVGVFGIDSGTPIINPGESAIVCFGRIAERPWVRKGRVVPRSLVEVSVSFDHRVIDGELGSLFLADVGRYLTDPAGTELAWS